MIEGVIVATEVPDGEHGAFRDALWVSVAPHLGELFAPDSSSDVAALGRVSQLPKAS